MQELDYTGNNLAEVAELLGNTLYEFRDRKFIIFTPSNNILLSPGDTLVKEQNGHITVRAPAPIWKGKKKK